MAERLATYSESLNEALREEMARDSSVFVFGEDVAVWGDRGGVYGVTKGLVELFGTSRVRDTPISEEALVGLALGAAVTGMRPVVELMYFDFVPLAMDPLVNQAAKLRYMFGGQVTVPLVLRSNVGASGGKAAQHSQSLESWMVHVPGLKVVMPSTPSDAKGLLKTAIRDNNPVVFLEHKLLYFKKGPMRQGDYTVPFGQASVRREGRHVTVVAMQAMLAEALSAAEDLANEGAEAEVIDPRTLVPLDIETIVASVKKTGRLVIVHEAAERGGWAAEVAMQAMGPCFDYLDAPIVRVCGANTPIPYAGSLEAVALPNRVTIAAALRECLTGTRAESKVVATDA